MPMEAPGMPGISKVGSEPPPLSFSFSSISLSSSSPVRSILRNFDRVSALDPSPTRASSTRSSAACSALASTWRFILSLVMEIAISNRSRTICSTSRPT